MHNTTWNIYLIRLLITIWFFIFPVVFACIFLFVRELNKNRDIFVIWAPFRRFKPYGYVFHNFLFIFMFMASIVNAFVFTYVFIDTYLFNMDSIYETVWKVEEHDNRAWFVWGTIFFGNLMHLACFCFYIYYNIYNTDSYFGEVWRKFIINFSKSKRFFILKRRHPKIFKKFMPMFLKAKAIVPEKEEVVITLN